MEIQVTLTEANSIILGSGGVSREGPGAPWAVWVASWGILEAAWKPPGAAQGPDLDLGFPSTQRSSKSRSGHGLPQHPA